MTRHTANGVNLKIRPKTSQQKDGRSNHRFGLGHSSLESISEPMKIG